MRFNRSPSALPLALLSSLIAACALVPEPPASESAAVMPMPEPAPEPIVIAETAKPYPPPIPAPEPDLWQKIREGFAMPPAAEHARIEYWQQFYATRFDHLESATGNARPFLWHVVEEIQSRNMPLELALLPIVESSYNPKAYSYAHASGVWQFMPFTARRFGLHEDWWYDGRRDVLRSTAAALDYLEWLHGRYDDWLLALAAYNAGEGRVDRALARASKHDFWALDLPRETENYVPKLLALKGLLEEPNCFAFEWPRLPDEPITRLVTLPGQVELAIAAEMMGISESELRALNPAMRRWATHPDGPHRLLVPGDRVQRLQAGLRERGVDELVSWRRHRIRPGDTLSTIAQRYGTRVAVLREANDLRGTLIRAGQHLLVPVGESTSPPPRFADGKTVYTVARGDSLWRIARRFGIGIDDLKSWNDITGNTIRPGQRLRVLADRG